MQCIFPYHSPKGEVFPCGRCVHCRINKREEWTTRMRHEQSYWSKSAFITLTYDDEHLPKDGGLDPHALTNFFKRLRINLDRTYGYHVPIKYFSCGEYGPKTFRPHYHAVVFGVDWTNPIDIKCISDSWPFCAPHMWKPRKHHGHISGAIAKVCEQTIKYVAGYVFKKALDNDTDKFIKQMEEEYGIILQRTFQRQSQGIGKRYCLDNAGFIIRNGYVKCGRRAPIPRYYRKCLGIDCETNSKFAESCARQSEQCKAVSKIDILQRRQAMRFGATVLSVLTRYREDLLYKYKDNPTETTLCKMFFRRIMSEYTSAREESHYFSYDLLSKQFIKSGYTPPPRWYFNWVSDELKYQTSLKRYQL